MLVVTVFRGTHMRQRDKGALHYSWPTFPGTFGQVLNNE
jgi:hypothetical protein